MKNEKKPSANHVRQHKKIIGSSPIVVVTNVNANQLQQPSLLKTVNSITTYVVTCDVKEKI